MWLLIVPLVIVFFLLLGVMAEIFEFALPVLFGAGWPLLLIGLGMWLFWRGDGRHRQRHGDRRAADKAFAGRRQHAARAQARQHFEARTSAPGPRERSELPIDVQVKVEQIRRKVDVLLSYADRFPPFSQDLYLVRQTANDYLPRTLETYLALPEQTAGKPLHVNGRTAQEELTAQLELLDSKLDDIAQDLERQDSDRLLANRRFLEDRFGLREVKEPRLA